MSVTSIISAVGNNNSIYPLLVRDCGIENPAKVIMTYNQNKSDKNIAKNAVRERIIDEYATSAIWLGGIPLVGKICDKFIKNKGFNPDISPELIFGDEFQNLSKNINTFKSKTPEAVNDLIKAANNTPKFKKLVFAKLITSLIVPTLVMGVLLPKINFGITKKIMKKNNSSNITPNKVQNISDFGSNLKNSNKKSPVSFGNNIICSLTKLSTVQKMAITDAGLSIGRVSTARNTNEKIDNDIKMAGMMYLNYIAPKQIAKGLDFLSNKIFKLNVNLDPEILSDSEFINAVKSKSIKLPNSNSAKDIINFIDNNTNSVYTNMAQKVKLIKKITPESRDPRAYLNIKELAQLKNNIEEFVKNANNSKNIDKLISKAKMIKCVNILANVAISSFLLAICLPKFQFMLRKLITKNQYEPGLIDNK